MKLSFLILLFSGITAFGGDPFAYRYPRSLEDAVRQAQCRMEASKREDLQRRLDSFLFHQGY
jgi:hypothetical protein